MAQLVEPFLSYGRTNKVTKKRPLLHPQARLAKNIRAPFRADLTQYHRRLKLATYFGPSTLNPKDPFKTPSTWEPTPDKLPLNLMHLNETDQKCIDQLRLDKDPPNLTTQEIEALYTIKKDPTIVIKPADKGSATVIMDRILTLTLP